MSQLVCIEGLGTSPDEVERTYATPYSQRLRDGALYRQKLLSRSCQGYLSIELALDHYHRRNPSLTREQATHLVNHGLRQRSDGSYAWKSTTSAASLARPVPPKAKSAS